ncbi:MAG: ABC transporter permease [Oscillospiraceae bacterium]|jgi:hypothetical protein|nr:ABC transporter permease [Oscillospiraceae bacterium]
MRYILKNVLSFIKNDIVIFILIILTVFSSAISLYFSQGLYYNYRKVNENETKGIYSFTINFNDSDERYVTKKMLVDCLLSIPQKSLDGIDFGMLITPTEIDYERMKHSGGGYLAYARFMISDGQVKNPEKFEKIFSNRLISGRWFTDEDFEKKTKAVIIGKNFKITFPDVPIKDNKLSYMGTEYDIIGTGDISWSLYITLESLDDDKRMGVKTSYTDEITGEEIPYTEGIELMFYDKNTENFEEQALTRQQYDDIKKAFDIHLGDLAVFPNLEIKDNENRSLNNTIIIISILIALLSAFNFAILYKSILVKRQKTLAVFRLCGMTRLKAILQYLFESLIISIPVFFLALLIYIKVLMPIFIKRFEYIQGAYSAKIYVLIFTLYFAVSVIILLVMFLTTIPRKAVIKRCL